MAWPHLDYEEQHLLQIASTLMAFASFLDRASMNLDAMSLRLISAKLREWVGDPEAWLTYNLLYEKDGNKDDANYPELGSNVQE